MLMAAVYFDHSPFGMPIHCFSFKKKKKIPCCIRSVCEHYSSVCGWRYLILYECMSACGPVGVCTCSEVRGTSGWGWHAFCNRQWCMGAEECPLCYQLSLELKHIRFSYPHLFSTPLFSGNRVIGYQSPWQLSWPFQPMASGALDVCAIKANVQARQHPIHHTVHFIVMSKSTW